MNKQNIKIEKLIYLLSFIAGLVFLSTKNYSLFHFSLELFGIIVSFAVLIIAANSYQSNNNSYLMFLGVAFCFYGTFNFLHIISHDRLGIIVGYPKDLSYQLKIISNFIISGSFLLSFIFIKKKINIRIIFYSYTVLFAIILLIVFYFRIFPSTFLDNNPTLFKTITQLFIIIISIISFLVLIKQKDVFVKETFYYLSFAFVFFIISQIVNFFSVLEKDSLDLYIHLLLLLYSYCIYKAIAQMAIKKPYELAETEIDNRMIIEKKLKESEILFKNITEMVDTSIVIRKDNQLVFVNEALEKIIGYKKEELLKMNFLDLISPEHREMVKEIGLARQRGEDIPSNYEFKIITKNNEIKWVNCFAKVITLSNEQYILATGFDITEAKTSQEKIIELKSFYETILENIIDGVLVFDKNDIIYYVNNGMQRIIDLPRNDIIGKNIFLDILDDNTELISYFEHSKEVFNILNFRGIRFNTPTKKLTYQSGYLIPLLKDNNYEGTIFTARDITNTIEMEDDLIESEQNYKRIIETANEGIWVIDNHNNTVLVNKTMADMLGYTMEEMIGKSLFDFIENELKESANKKLIEIYQIKKTVCDFRLKCKNNSFIWVIISVNMLFDKNENYIGALGMLTDITTRKIAEENLKKSEEKLKSLLFQKETLLKEMHHRIKNNLYLIMNLISLKKDKYQNEVSTEIFEEIKSRIGSIAIIHDKLYKSENFEEIDIETYIKELIDSVYNLFRKDVQNVRIEVDIDKILLNIEQAISCGLILNELLTNSFKYAFKDIENCIISIKFKNLEQNKFLFEVKDNGVGYYIDNINKTDDLGLKLVKILVEQLNGKIEINNTNGCEIKIYF